MNAPLLNNDNDNNKEFESNNDNRLSITILKENGYTGNSIDVENDNDNDTESGGHHYDGRNNEANNNHTEIDGNGVVDYENVEDNEEGTGESDKSQGVNIKIIEKDKLEVEDNSEMIIEDMADEQTTHDHNQAPMEE